MGREGGEAVDLEITQRSVRGEMHNCTGQEEKLVKTRRET